MRLISIETWILTGLIFTLIGFLFAFSKTKEIKVEDICYGIATFVVGVFLGPLTALIVVVDIFDQWKTKHGKRVLFKR